MGIAENKAIVLDFMARLSSDNPNWDVLSDTVTWWMQGLGTVGKQQFMATATGMKGIMNGGEMFIDHVTAEEDRVAVESHSCIPLKDGRLFENTYHFLFILEDGKLVAAREHFDTGYARQFFGEAAQDELVPPDAR